MPRLTASNVYSKLLVFASLLPIFLSVWPPLSSLEDAHGLVCAQLKAVIALQLHGIVATSTGARIRVPSCASAFTVVCGWKSRRKRRSNCLLAKKFNKTSAENVGILADKDFNVTFGEGGCGTNFRTTKKYGTPACSRARSPLYTQKPTWCGGVGGTSGQLGDALGLVGAQLKAIVARELRLRLSTASARVPASCSSSWGACAVACVRAAACVSSRGSAVPYACACIEEEDMGMRFSKVVAADSTHAKTYTAFPCRQKNTRRLPLLKKECIWLRAGALYRRAIQQA